MATLSTDRERLRSWHYGFPYWSWPFPIDEPDDEWFAAVWGTFLAGPEISRSEFYIDNHTVRALATMIEQFKPAEDFKKLISVFTDELQITENTIEDLFIERLIATSDGEQLDGIGSIIGEDRQGRNDDDYRTAILFKIYINISSGQPDIVINVLKVITSATQVRMIELFPAALSLFTDGSVLPGDLVATMRKVIPSGVWIQITSSFGETNTFEFDTEGGIPYDEGDGFSELNYTEGGETIGGIFSELVL